MLREIRKVISPFMEYPMDILIYSNEEFSQRASLITTLEHKIYEDGVNLYG